MKSVRRTIVVMAIWLVVLWARDIPTQASTQIPGAPQERPIAIVNATIHPITSPAIENGSILFAEGRIVSLGQGIELAPDVLRVDGHGQHVYPGLFCAGGQLGLIEINSVRATRDESETGSVNPNAKVQVAVNPDSELIPVTRANGVLMTLTLPTGGLVSGMAAILQLDGWTWEDMSLKSPAGMHIQWPRLGPATDERDRPLKRLHELFDHAEQYRRGRRDDAIDVRYEAMLPILDGTIPIIASADSQRQIESAVAFARQRNLRLIIYGGYDAEQCATLLSEHDIPVIIPAVYRLPRRRSDPFDAAYTLPERLRQAGVRFCIAGVDRFSASNLRNLPYHAATAVAYGLPHNEALKAVTLWPAQILGVAGRVGSLESGKDATLIVTDGDPLETTTNVNLAYIEGRRVDLGNRHETLWRKYREKYRRLDMLDR